MLLWIPIAIVTLVAIAVVVRPLVRATPPVTDGVHDDERRLAVFRDRKREIERERAAGRLSDSEAAQAQDDLVRQLAEDLPEATAGAAATPGTATGGRTSGTDAAGGAFGTDTTARMTANGSPLRARGTLTAAVLVALLIPVIAIGIYREVGAPHLATAGGGPAAAPIDAGQIEAMIARIEERTRTNPEDGQAWAMLAQARKVQGRYAEAITAFAQAVQRIPDNARLLADYAEATALQAGGDFTGRPIELLARALDVDPQEPKAIALMGAAQYRAGHLEQARALLTRLETFLEPGSAEAEQIRSILTQIDGEIAAGRTGAARSGRDPDAGSPVAAPSATGQRGN